MVLFLRVTRLRVTIMPFRLSRDGAILILTGEADQSLIKKQDALACYQGEAPVGRCHLEIY